MSDPDRIADGAADDVGAALVRAAGRYRISDETRKRAFAVAGLSAGSAALATGAAAAKGAAAGSKWIAWALAGVLGGAATVGAGYLALGPSRRANRPNPPPSATLVTPPTMAPSAPAMPLERVAQEPEAPPAVDRSAPVAPSTPVSSPPRHAASAGSRSGATADLQAELAALDAASNAISRGDVTTALSLLDRFERDFPHGSLSLEATVLRVEALERVGRHAEAVQLARAFLRRYPASPLADRLRPIVGE